MTESISLSLEKKFESARIETANDKPGVAIVTATKNYIHIDDFKKVFNYLRDLVKEKKISKLVFDKRELDTFHQPSMEWYYTEWKEDMFQYGLKTHRKILPKNDFFNFAVKAAKKDLEQKFPDGKYKEMDIQYKDSLEEAIES